MGRGARIRRWGRHRPTVLPSGRWATVSREPDGSWACRAAHPRGKVLARAATLADLRNRLTSL